MITHFAEIELYTLDLSVVRLVYHERLRFPILAETDHSLTLALTSHTVLKFTLRQEPITPVHLAFQVAHAGFAEVVDKIKRAGVLVTHAYVEWHNGPNLYLRDGEGHELEIMAQANVANDGFPPCHYLGILHLREVAFPVGNVHCFRRWLRNTLEMKSCSDAAADDFDVVVGGTAYVVVSALNRHGYPSGARSVPANQRVTFGTPDWAFMHRVRDRLATNGALVAEQPDEIEFQHAGYHFALRYTPQFCAEWPTPLDL
ncbi:MAG: hypothetical protein R3C14_31380 [Caldilineaceae bacterium]